MSRLARGMSPAVLAALPGGYAVSLRLRVDALDGSGQVTGSTVGYVLGEVPPSKRAYFEIKAPAKAASYRVTIESFAWRAYGRGRIEDP